VRRRPRPGKAPRLVRLKPVYRQAKAAVAQLRRFEQTREVKAAIARLNRCMEDIFGLCGPNMVIVKPSS
jgi:hypothetical protein